MRFALAFLAGALAAAAAGIDGQWNAEIAAGKNTRSFTLSLKSRDGQVSGAVITAGKKKPREHKIQNARLDGNQLTFTTVQTGKKATVNFSWQVTIDGDQMTGTRTREGAKHGQPFKARKTG